MKRRGRVVFPTPQDDQKLIGGGGGGGGGKGEQDLFTFVDHAWISAA